MSQENVVTVPLGGPDPRRRTLDEWGALALPWLFRLGSRIVLGLPQRSRIRRALFSHFTIRTMDAFSRNDPRVVQLRADPNCVIEVAHAPADLGLDPAYHGHDGIARILEQFHLGTPGPRWHPEKRLELPDGRFLHFSTVESGAARIEFAQLLSFERGAVVHERLFFGSWAEALKAAGLSE